MSKIDVDNLIISLLNGQDLTKSEKKVLHHALQDQGLRIKDGEIVEIRGNQENASPKFKILKGNWYVCIKDFESFTCGKAYECIKHWRLTDDEGNSVYFYTDIPYKEYFRPWTIQDAKPGDVLAAEEDGDTWIGIFKEWDGYDTQFFSSYCQLPFGEDKIEIDVDTLYSEGCLPATKEQSELLSAKMKENGYGFDFRTNTLFQVHKLKEPAGKLKECIDKMKREELTEFEQKLGNIIREHGGHLGTVNNDKLKAHAAKLLDKARKQIASEIDSEELLDTFLANGGCHKWNNVGSYKVAVEDTIEKIKKG